MGDSSERHWYTAKHTLISSGIYPDENDSYHVTSVKFKVRNTTIVLQIAIEKHKKSLKIPTNCVTKIVIRERTDKYNDHTKKDKKDNQWSTIYCIET